MAKIKIGKFSKIYHRKHDSEYWSSTMHIVSGSSWRYRVAARPAQPMHWQIIQNHSSQAQGGPKTEWRQAILNCFHPSCIRATVNRICRSYFINIHSGTVPILNLIQYYAFEINSKWSCVPKLNRRTSRTGTAAAERSARRARAGGLPEHCAPGCARLASPWSG